MPILLWIPTYLNYLDQIIKHVSNEEIQGIIAFSHTETYGAIFILKSSCQDTPMWILLAFYI